jgi:hypothetical protein
MGGLTAKASSALTKRMPACGKGMGQRWLPTVKPVWASMAKGMQSWHAWQVGCC